MKLKLKLKLYELKYMTVSNRSLTTLILAYSEQDAIDIFSPLMFDYTIEEIQGPFNNGTVIFRGYEV